MNGPFRLVVVITLIPFNPRIAFIELVSNLVQSVSFLMASFTWASRADNSGFWGSSFPGQSFLEPSSSPAQGLLGGSPRNRVDPFFRFRTNSFVLKIPLRKRASRAIRN